MCLRSPKCTVECGFGWILAFFCIYFFLQNYSILLWFLFCVVLHTKLGDGMRIFPAWHCCMNWIWYYAHILLNSMVRIERAFPGRGKARSNLMEQVHKNAHNNGWMMLMSPMVPEIADAFFQKWKLGTQKWKRKPTKWMDNRIRHCWCRWWVSSLPPSIFSAIFFRVFLPLHLSLSFSSKMAFKNWQKCHPFPPPWNEWMAYETAGNWHGWHTHLLPSLPATFSVPTMPTAQGIDPRNTHQPNNNKYKQRAAMPP